jgi:hypothetical protein
MVQWWGVSGWAVERQGGHGAGRPAAAGEFECNINMICDMAPCCGRVWVVGLSQGSEADRAGMAQRDQLLRVSLNAEIKG